MLILPSRRLLKLPRGNIKPSGIPRIDWTHPLAQGLLFYGFDTGTGIVLDLVSGAIGTHTTGATRAPVSATAWGEMIAWNGSDGIYFTPSAAVRTASGSGVVSGPGNNFSFACGVVQTIASATQFIRPFGRTGNNNGSAPHVNWIFEAVVTNGMAAAIDNGGADGAIGSGVALSQNNWHTLSATCNGTIGGQGTLYIDGVLSTQSATTTYAFRDTDTGDSIFFSGANTAAVANPWTGYVPWGAFWGPRVLTPTDAYTLHTQPYSMLIFPEDEQP